MPHDHDAPLPPLPAEGEELQGFVRRYPPEELARLAIEIHDGPHDNEMDDLTGELTQAIMNEFARHSPEVVLVYAECLLAAQTPSLHSEVAMMAAEVLGRGIQRFEEIIWDELLRTSDLNSLGYLIERLDLIMCGEDLLFDSTVPPFGQYEFVYSPQARMAHRVKLNRARHRAEAMRKS